MSVWEGNKIEFVILWRKAMATERSYPLTAGELSLILNISEFTIKRLAKSKQFPCIYVNRQPRFNLEILLEYFRRLEGDVA
jgi:hypothetical protein